MKFFVVSTKGNHSIRWIIKFHDGMWQYWCYRDLDGNKLREYWSLLGFPAFLIKSVDYKISKSFRRLLEQEVFLRGLQ